MALIELDPGERFEHRHAGVSTTTLVSGQVELELAGRVVTLGKKPVTIPPGEPHVMHNTGIIKAVVRCTHSVPT